MYRSHKDRTIGKKRKPHHKPNKKFKRLHARIRRSKDKQELIHNRDPIRHHKTDVWDWN